MSIADMEKFTKKKHISLMVPTQMNIISGTVSASNNKVKSESNELCFAFNLFLKNAIYWARSFAIRSLKFLLIDKFSEKNSPFRPLKKISNASTVLSIELFS